ncbi:MAG: lipase [Lachnospiraceae bacterium]|nr:lipase [Lachnospiraceae bacterium]
MIQKHWVTMWGNAMSITNHTPQGYSRNITLRYPVTVPFAGEALRLTFDHFCGTEPVTISRAVIARCADDSRKTILTETLHTLSFAGSPSVTIPAGGRVTCDPVSFPVEQGQTLSVSFYLGEFTQMRSSVIITGPLSGGQYAVGDHCCTDRFPVDDCRNTSCCYFLSDVEVLTASENHAVVCYGDSITAQDWPDYLQQLFLAQPDNHTAIVRKAASGTRILRQYSCITYESYGLKATVRFPHELPVSGADTIIIQQGINDIIHPVGTDVNIFRPMSDLPTLEELKDGYRYYLKETRKMGMFTLTGTLLPIEGWRTYADFREVLKNGFNDWLRSGDGADGCIDFDLALRDPDRPASFAPGFDSGDHLHPSAAAYRQMAQTAYDALNAFGRC